MLYDFRKNDILKHSVIKYAFHCLSDNQFQKSWDRCHKTFEFQQTTIPPPPVQCCVPFLVGFDMFWFKQH